MPGNPKYGQIESTTKKKFIVTKVKTNGNKKNKPKK